MDRVDVLIIGAGIAGLSTAFHLGRLGFRRVLILEKEPLPATHSSGKNAALFYQTDGDRLQVELALESRRLHFELGLEDNTLLRTTGSLTLVRGGQQTMLLECARELGLKTLLLDACDVRHKVPVLREEAFATGLWTPTDGVLDIHALAQAHLRGALAQGARLLTRCEVTKVVTESGRVRGVVTTEGPISADIVVNAAGAWAGKLVADSVASPLPLKPCRRHLVVSEPTDLLDPSAPFVWDRGASCYFRPESGGVLMSPCDEDPVDPDRLVTSPAALDALAHKLETLAPALGRIGAQRSWACIRTLTPDGRAVVGEDPGLRRLFWVAGLGGHGMTAGPAIGRLAARAIAGEMSSYLSLLSPARFAEVENIGKR